jgi:2-methylcitrate dehydratase PrpD
MPSIAGELAAFVSAAGDQVPALALDRARMSLCSTLASAAVGYDIASAEIIRGLAVEQGGTAEASVWFARGSRLPAAAAARANAVASDAAASDDSDLRNIAHIGTIVSATALAVGQRQHASGRAVLTAMVLGYEVAGRIGQAITPGFSARGFHGSVITIFGGAVAAGWLLGLSPAGLTQAIAIAATSIGGLYAAANTSVAREYHAGLSALLGVEAALAAGAGFAVDERILEVPRGFLATFGAEDRGVVTRDLGQHWEIASHLAIKLMPGAHPYHAAAEAAATAAIELDVAPGEIARLEVAARSLGRDLVYHPTDLVGMAHSLPYFVAAAAVDREFTWVHATPAKVADPVIAAVQDRVVLDLEPAHHTTAGRTCGGRVALTTTDGRTAVCALDAPRGSGYRGIEWRDVEAKYRALLGSVDVPPAQVERTLGLIEGLLDLDDVAALPSALPVR